MFIVTEYQTTDGSTSTLTDTFSDARQAEAKYHAILAAAAVSGIAKHGAIMYTETGYLKQECYETEE